MGEGSSSAFNVSANNSLKIPGRVGGGGGGGGSNSIMTKKKSRMINKSALPIQTTKMNVTTGHISPPQ